MKLKHLTGVTSTLFFITIGPLAFAQNTVQVAVSSFQQPSGAVPFSAFPVSVDLRYAPLFSLVPDELNAATHLLIEGLVPMDQNAEVLVSNYEAYNLSNQELQDVGTIYLKADPNAQLSQDAVASPIVGLVKRQGSWANFSSSSPTAEIGQSSGVSTYTGNGQSGGVINFNLNQGGLNFTGSTNYTVPDTDTIVFPQHLTIGSFTYRPTTLVRDGSRYYGLLETSAVVVNYDAALLVIELSGFPDLDGDGIPDITDADVVGNNDGGIDLISGDWAWNSTFGWFYGVENSVWANSNFMGFMFVNEYNNTNRWMYHYIHGWLWYEVGTYNGPNGMWLWSENYGWVNTRESWNGFFYINDMYQGNRWGWFGSMDFFPE